MRRAKYVNALDDAAVLTALDRTTMEADIFDNADTLENKITESLSRRGQSKEAHGRIKSCCLYFAKLLPLVRLLADIGGVAAQVHIRIGYTLIFRQLDVFPLPLRCEELLSSLRYSQLHVLKLTVQALAIARNVPKDLSSNLDRVSYQASRLANLRGSEQSESLTEKSLDLLTSIVKYYSVCLIVFDQGLLG